MTRQFDGVKVFSATMFADRERLGEKVTDWIASLQLEVRRQTAEISALDSEGSPIATWNLDGVYPVKWNGPSLDIGNNQVATETLELSHNGFLA